MSIVDWLILFFAALAGAIVFLAVLITIAIVGWWMRRIARKDEQPA